MRRRWLAVATVLWLGSQLMALSAAPAALCAAMPEAAATACTCSHADGRPCPMHGTAHSKSTCSCRGTSDAGRTILAGLLTPAAVLPVTVAAVRLGTNGAGPLVATEHFSDHSTLLDAPPPRA